MPTPIDLDLKARLASSAHIFWAGSLPPLARMQASTAILDPKQDYRLPPSEHQRYDVVYLVEKDLGYLKAWPLIVDEALRLLAPDGILVIRMHNTPLCSIFELKHQLFMWGDLVPHFEFTTDDGATEFAVRNVRTERRPASLTGFSIGVITDGKRQELLYNFLRSVQALKRTASQEVEMLVCAPATVQAQVEADFPGVVFVEDTGAFSTQGWVTHKKNQLVARAQYENLVIAHDRYTLMPDFLTALEAFGGDFSFVVSRQVRPDGRRFPDWVALGNAWSWSAPAMLEYGDYTRHLYINGGLMIAKTACLRQTTWNDLIFWNQAEDVELTRRLRNLGHVPRLARRVVAVSHVTRHATMESFEPMPAMPDRYSVSGPALSNAEIVTPSFPYATQVHFGSTWGRMAAHLGVFTDEHWREEADGLSLSPGAYGEIAFRLSDTPYGPQTLLLTVKKPGASLQILVNDVEQHAVEVSPGVLKVVIARERFALGRVLRLHLKAPAASFRLQGLRIEPTGWALGGRLPVTAEGAQRMIGRAEVPPTLDGGALCLTDLQTLVRGARRIAVLMPSDVTAIAAAAGFLSALRVHTREDTDVRIIASAEVLPLFDGFDAQIVEWERVADDRAYRTMSLEALQAFGPEVLINAFAPRAFAPDLFVLESRAAGILGFDARDYALEATSTDYISRKYSRLIADTSLGVSEALVRALDLPATAPALWPEVTHRAAAAEAFGAMPLGDRPLLAVLGDDLRAFKGSRLQKMIASHVAEGWCVVGLGGAETREPLQRAFAPFPQDTLNLAGALTLPAQFAVLQAAQVCAGGGPSLRALAEIAGCQLDAASMSTLTPPTAPAPVVDEMPTLTGATL